MDDNMQAIRLAQVAQAMVQQNQAMAQQMIAVMQELSQRVEAIALVALTPRTTEFVYDDKGRAIASTQTIQGEENGNLHEI